MWRDWSPNSTLTALNRRIFSSRTMCLKFQLTNESTAAIVATAMWHQHLLVQLANPGRGVRYFGRRHIRQNRYEPSRAEVADEPVRPLGKLGIEAPARDRCVDVDS